ncbi:UbiA family prenyltransferase [Streptomyces sp. NBC_01725]|uniref:UbiA family prenyltransferase n=1 Tax=Streptomyces sp. NBC_01725 TaxID=2975923 RepID=UPI002E28162F|nr:UbiA family prenyltransferase [Streptomyces sp. NBC_01725]
METKPAEISEAASKTSRTIVLRGLLRLSKIRVFQHYFGLALAWLLLSPEALQRPGATTAMLLFLLGSVAIVACACASDDIAGFRNGSDLMNYQSDEQLRDIRAKPLLTGTVTERQALTFAVGSGFVAVLAGAAAFWVLDWDAPFSAYALYLLGFAFSVQYSVGLKVSYRRGGGETLLCFSTAAGLLAPFLAVNRDWTWPAVAQALLLGLWLVMVSSYSNVNDVAGDRMAGRRTLAVTTGRTVQNAAMASFFLLSAGLLTALAMTGGWPGWLLLTALPATALHAAQLYHGPVRGQWLRARKLGLIAYNLGFAGIAVPTFFALHR